MPMASILEFRRPELRSATARLGAGRESADVVFFPGVRYERWGDASAPEPESPKPRRGRRRDHLDLED